MLVRRATNERDALRMKKIVGVQEQASIRTASFRHGRKPCISRRRHASVRLTNGNKSRVPRNILVNNRLGIVRRTVVDAIGGEVPIRLRDEGFKASPQIPRLIVNRYDNR